MAAFVKFIFLMFYLVWVSADTSFSSSNLSTKSYAEANNTGHVSVIENKDKLTENHKMNKHRSHFRVSKQVDTTTGGSTKLVPPSVKWHAPGKRIRNTPSRRRSTTATNEKSSKLAFSSQGWRTPGTWADMVTGSRNPTVNGSTVTSSYISGSSNNIRIFQVMDEMNQSGIAINKTTPPDSNILSTTVPPWMIELIGILKNDNALTNTTMTDGGTEQPFVTLLPPIDAESTSYPWTTFPPQHDTTSPLIGNESTTDGGTEQPFVTLLPPIDAESTSYPWTTFPPQQDTTSPLIGDESTTVDGTVIPSISLGIHDKNSTLGPWITLLPQRNTTSSPSPLIGNDSAATGGTDSPAITPGIHDKNSTSGPWFTLLPQHDTTSTGNETSSTTNTTASVKEPMLGNEPSSTTETTVSKKDVKSSTADMSWWNYPVIIKGPKYFTQPSWADIQERLYFIGNLSKTENALDVYLFGTKSPPWYKWKSLLSTSYQWPSRHRSSTKIIYHKLFFTTTTSTPSTTSLQSKKSEQPVSARENDIPNAEPQSALDIFDFLKSEVPWIWKGVALALVACCLMGVAILCCCYEKSTSDMDGDRFAFSRPLGSTHFSKSTLPQASSNREIVSYPQSSSRMGSPAIRPGRVGRQPYYMYSPTGYSSDNVYYYKC